MRYLTIETDLKSYIKQNILDDISEENYLIFDTIEEATLDLIDSYIGSIYDTVYEYNQTGSNRNNFLIRIAVDIFIYDFYTRMTTDVMSDLREMRYKEALEMLRKISIGEISPTLSLKDPSVDSTASSSSIYGSNPQVSTQW